MPEIVGPLNEAKPPDFPAGFLIDSATAGEGVAGACEAARARLAPMVCTVTTVAPPAIVAVMITAATAFALAIAISLRALLASEDVLAMCAVAAAEALAAAR